MKKRVLISCLLLAIVTMLSCVMAFGASAAETVTMTEVAAGTAIGDKQVTISSADELYKLQDYVAEGGVTEGKTFVLTADVELADLVSIANKFKSNAPDIGSAEKPFKGTFLGGNHSISNLIISKNNIDGVAAPSNRGLFAYTDGATIQNVYVALGRVDYATDSIGGLIGYAKNTTVSYCRASGSGLASSNGNAQNSIGGLIGTAENCDITFVVSTATVAGNDKVGAIVGDLKDSTVETAFVLNAKVTGTVAGGVAGATTGSSSVANAIVKATVAGSAVSTYSGKVGTATIGFDKDYKLDTAVMEGDIAIENAISAINYFISASEHENKSYFKLDANDVITLVECAAHVRPADAFDCEVADCVNCAVLLKAIVEHRRPASAAVCATGVMCEVCNKVEVAPTAEHNRPADAPACQEGLVCDVCNEEMVPPAQHITYDQADCVNPAKCNNCKKVLEEANGHEWDGNQTCNTDEICKVCKVPNPEKLKTGDHIKKITAPTCDEAVTCVTCGRILTDENGKLLKALGHLTDGKPATCGKAQVCGREIKDADGNVIGHCPEIIEDATHQHTIDWDNAVVEREPTPDKPGRVVGTCSVCGNKEEKYPKYEAPEGDGPSTTPPVDDPADKNDEDKGGLPTGALIGIIAGAVVVVGGGAAAVIVLSKKKKGASKDED